MFWMIIGSTVLGCAGLWLYLYSWNKGHFDDEELIKYQLFREEDPEE